MRLFEKLWCYAPAIGSPHTRKAPPRNQPRPPAPPPPFPLPLQAFSVLVGMVAVGMLKVQATGRDAWTSALTGTATDTHAFYDKVKTQHMHRIQIRAPLFCYNSPLCGFV